MFLLGLFFHQTNFNVYDNESEMLSNIAETSTNEKSLEKEDEKSDAKGQIAMINSLNEKFPFKKIRRIRSPILKYKKHGTES